MDGARHLKLLNELLFRPKLCFQRGTKGETSNLESPDLALQKLTCVLGSTSKQKQSSKEKGGLI